MNKASGGDGIPAELFKILKDDAVKVLHSIWQQIWKTQQYLHDWKMSVFIPVPKKGNAKESCMQIKKKQLELDMEQWTGPKLGKESEKAVYCHPVTLYIVNVYTENIMQNARLDESQVGIPSPPLALFIVILPKAHLTSHSRMSGCR